VLSHLSVCFRTWCVFSLGSVHLGICEHSNRTKTIALRPDRGGLGPIANGSLEV